MSNTSLDISDLGRKTPAILLPLLVLLLTVGRGSSVPTASQQLSGKLLKLVPIYPGATSTSMSYPHPNLILPDEQLVTASSKYLMTTGVSEIETWYLNHLESLGWKETGSSSFNSRTGAVSDYGIEFTSSRYPLVYYQVSLKPLSKNETLAEIVVADAETPRPSSSYLSQTFDRANVTIYTVTSTMVPKKTTMYSFLLKQASKHVVRSYVVTNSTVVHQWVKMLNAMPVAPKMETVDCPLGTANTRYANITFASKNSANKTVTVPSDCRGLPGIGSTTLWDPTAKFWRTIISYPQPPKPPPGGSS